jgi:hypothetical protein
MRQNLLHASGWKAGGLRYFPAERFSRQTDYTNRECIQSLLTRPNKKTLFPKPNGGFSDVKCPVLAYAGVGNGWEATRGDRRRSPYRFRAYAAAANRGPGRAASRAGGNVERFLPFDARRAPRAGRQIEPSKGPGGE